MEQTLENSLTLTKKDGTKGASQRKNSLESTISLSEEQDGAFVLISITDPPLSKQTPGLPAPPAPKSTQVLPTPLIFSSKGGPAEQISPIAEPKDKEEQSFHQGGKNNSVTILNPKARQVLGTGFRQRAQGTQVFDLNFLKEPQESDKKSLKNNKKTSCLTRCCSSLGALIYSREKKTTKKKAQLPELQLASIGSKNP